MAKNKELHHLMQELREELGKLDKSSKAYSEISMLITDIELELKKIENSVSEVSITDKIRTQIEEFEVGHPRITNVLNDIMIKLLNIGI